MGPVPHGHSRKPRVETSSPLDPPLLPGSRWLRPSHPSPSRASHFPGNPQGCPAGNSHPTISPYLAEIFVSRVRSEPPPLTSLGPLVSRLLAHILGSLRPSERGYRKGRQGEKS